MATQKKRSAYSLKRVWQLIRNGLFLQGLRFGLAKIGLNIMPYYWVQEEITKAQEPVIKGENKDFHFKTLNQQNITSVLSKIDSINEKKINESLNKGQEMVGLENNGNIAAYMFIELNDFTHQNHVFEIKKHEAYLLNMFTFDEFRGKNLAPYLRYCSYRYLETKHINTKYSISNYFNKSAIRFKQKLNSKHIKLYVYIELFKLVKWHFRLKKYT